MISRTLGHYTIEQKIGEGGMGAVYEGEDTRLLRRVAIKVVPSPRIRNEKERQRLIHEARMASAINHPNICTIYDVGQADAWYYIVMEYIEGQTLREIIEHRGPLSEKEAAKICVQVCNALAAAHEKGIVHRDIKPDNIMISTAGQVKIMDFGLAKLVDESSVLAARRPDAKIADSDLISGIEGTALYMAPEQIDRGRVDARTDIYALGAVLYEMLTGEPPFHGADSVSLITAILEAPTPSPDDRRPELSTAISNTVQKALARAPEDRFASVKEFKTALKEIASPPKKRRGAFPTVWLTITMILALGLGGMLWLRGQKRGNVNVVNIRELRPSDQPESNPIFSADGSRIAYLVKSDAPPTRQKLVLEDLRSGRITRIALDVFGNEGFRGPSDWSPDMKWILLASQAGGFNAIDTSGTKVQRFSDFGFEARWSPDGRRIAFSRFDPVKLTQNNEIWVYDLASRRAHRISPADGRGYGSPSWSPDNRRIVCVGGIGSDRALWLIDTETHQARLLLVDESGAEMPVWSSSGRYIYFIRAGSELWRLRVGLAEAAALGVPERVFDKTGIMRFSLARNGNKLVFGQRTLTEEFWHFKLPLSSGAFWEHADLLLRPQNWGTTNLDVSPTGDFLVLETAVGNRRALIQLDLHNPNRRVLYDAQDAFGPAFSPDGKWVAFDAGGGNNADIWQVSVDNRSAEKLFEHPGADWMPRYSPDGKKLSFVSNRDGQFDIWLFDLNDGTFQKVTHTPAMESGGYWSRAGDKLAFFRTVATENRSGVWILNLRTGLETKVYDIPNLVIDATTTIAWGPGDKTLFFSDGQGLRRLDLVTGESQRPLDRLGRLTEHARYVVRENSLYVIQRNFVTNVSVAEIRE
jgi:serine/threonine protein kinase